MITLTGQSKPGAIDARNRLTRALMTRDPLARPNFNLLLATDTVTIRDMIFDGMSKGRSVPERAEDTIMVFPYRGVFVRHGDGLDIVAEANQVLFFNKGENYSLSHPVRGGGASLSLAINEDLFRELIPKSLLCEGDILSFRDLHRRVDPRAQALVALLRHSLNGQIIEVLEAETLALTLVRRALGEQTSHASRASYGQQKLVDRAKLVLSSDLARRWTLSEIAAEVGVSPVYLTQTFRQVEQVPLYRYHLRLRLARALDLLGKCDDLMKLGLDLGFSSHSHFSAAFRWAYGRTPAEFQRALKLR